MASSVIELEQAINDVEEWAKAEKILYEKIRQNPTQNIIKLHKKEHLLGNGDYFQHSYFAIKVNDKFEIVRNEQTLGKGAEGRVIKATLKDGTFFSAPKIMFKSEKQYNEILIELGRLISVYARIKENKVQEAIDQQVSADKKTKYYHFLQPIVGKDLKKTLQNSHLSESSKLRLALEAAKSLKTLHDKNIIHRDVKADNFIASMLDNGEVEHATIIDFGCSAKLNGASADLPLKGSPNNMPPECYGKELKALVQQYAQNKRQEVSCKQNGDLVSSKVFADKAGAIYQQIGGYMEKTAPHCKATDMFAFGNMLQNEFKFTLKDIGLHNLQDNDPNNRPTIEDVIDILSEQLAIEMEKKQIILDNIHNHPTRVLPENIAIHDIHILKDSDNICIIPEKERNNILNSKKPESNFHIYRNPLGNDSTLVLKASSNAIASSADSLSLYKGDVLKTQNGYFVMYEALGIGNRGAVVLVQNLETLEFEAMKFGYGLKIERRGELSGPYKDIKSSLIAESTTLNALKQKGDLTNYQLNEFNQGQFIICSLNQPYIPGITGEQLKKQLISHTVNFQLLNMINILGTGLLKLGAIHQNNFLHMDIKPENFKWDPINEELNFIDFGESMSLFDASSKTQFIGNTAYSAPETFPKQNKFHFEERNYSTKSDIYSFGLCMNEFLNLSHLDDDLKLELADIIERMTLESLEERADIKTALHLLANIINKHMLHEQINNDLKQHLINEKFLTLETESNIVEVCQLLTSELQTQENTLLPIENIDNVLGNLLEALDTIQEAAKLPGQAKRIRDSYNQNKLNIEHEKNSRQQLFQSNNKKQNTHKKNNNGNDNNDNDKKFKPKT